MKRLLRYSANGINAKMDTVNQDADQWNVAPPLTFSKVVTLLQQQLRSLVLVRPR